MMTPAIRCLVWTNILVFALQAMYYPNFDLAFQMSYIGSESFRFYQMFTHSLMHGGMWHLFFNVFIIVMLGNALERVWGFRRMLVFYGVAALGGALLHTGFNMYQIYQMVGTPFPDINEAIELNNLVWFESTTAPKQMLSLYFGGMLGASGVVFGIMVAFAYLFPTARLSFFLLPISINAKWLVIVYVAYEAYMAFIVNPSDQIAHFAHLGGGLFGFLLARWWVYTDLERDLKE